MVALIHHYIASFKEKDITSSGNQVLQIYCANGSQHAIAPMFTVKAPAVGVADL